MDPPNTQKANQNVDDSQDTLKHPIKDAFMPKPETEYVGPNYFLAFQVNNPDIHQKIKSFQEELIKNKPHLHECLSHMPFLHITLALTHLSNDEEVTIVKNAFKEWADKNLESLIENPINVSFKGIGTFGKGKVAYIKVEPGENSDRINNLSTELQTMLKNAGFPDKYTNKVFTPHLTIFKSRGVKGAERDLFSLTKGKECYFGSQLVSSLQFLEMAFNESFEYYECVHQVQIFPEPDYSDHSDCCKPIPKAYENWRLQCKPLA